ncbi:exonuclease SbcCD subunit D [Erysipelothrix sp. HDW6C]|uniref:exonuclease SbcCD subunit D n=1 Tax=Erysipelothrix sp. HDW6C TaxID=2714930 RepID=UPI00140D3B83|nr:exonuclease SbcCD subunit D [Erysipelothrix sp. HDW6C]QIK70009.1 exonuclease SbcCD subunit D [Erysipelothrix sp. HDW6C]
MKIVHIADLHIGRKLMEFNLIKDQEYIFNQIIDIVRDRHANVVIIAGDIYDKASPSEEAFRLWDSFLLALAALDIHVIVTAGNHDSPERLGIGSRLLKNQNIHFSTEYSGVIEMVQIDSVDFYPIPFVKPSSVRNASPDFSGQTYEDAYRFIIDNIEINPLRKSVLIAHQFFINGSSSPMLSESEVAPAVGGLDAIDVELLDKFDYVALGHIHRPQKVGRDTIRYAGSPLKYSFSEVRTEKSVVMLEINEVIDFEMIPLIPLRDVREIVGYLDDLILVADEKSRHDLIHVILKDERDVFDAMGKIRSVYPNALTLEFDNAIRESDVNLKRAEVLLEKQPLEMFSTFFEEQLGRPMENDETAAVTMILNEVEENQ